MPHQAQPQRRLPLPGKPGERCSPMPRPRHIGPLLGSLLCSAAIPAFGNADIGDSAPPPRLRLSLALEAWSQPTASPPRRLKANPDVARPPAGLPGAARLTLAMALGRAGTQTDGGGSEPPLAPAAPAPRPAIAPASNAVASRGPGTPVAPEQPGHSPSPFTPPRPGNPIQLAASDTKVTTSTDSGGDPSAPTGGSDAQVVGNDEFLPADELPSSPRATAPAVRRESQSATSKSSRGWGMAPIRWGGSISAGLSRRTTDADAGSSNQIYEGRLRASSYVVAPYIALISGDVALTSVRSQSDSAGSAGASNLTGTSVTGSGTLNVFPQSRFPFQASLAVSDSRNESTFTDTNTRSVRYSLRQDYRPEAGKWATSAQYDRSQLEGDFGADTVDRVSGNFSNSFGKHTLSANGTASSNETTDSTLRDYFAVSNHGYLFSDELRIDSTASMTAQEFDLNANNNAVSGSSHSAQVFSFASWTPQDSKWRGTANARYFQVGSTVAGNTVSNSNVGIAGSLTYQASRNLNVFGSVSANSAGSGGFSSSQSLGAGYSGDPITIGDYYYTWYSSGSLGNSSSSEGISSRSTSVTAGHSLQRSWRLSELAQLSGSVNQTAGTSRSTGLGSRTSTSLTHSASLSLQANPSDRLSGFLSTSVSDSRSLGDNPSTFQLVNVQLSGNWRISVYSEMSSNLTWQMSRQQNEPFATEVGFESTTERSQSSSISGNLGYRHARAFGVRGLRYSLDFRANQNQLDSRTSGNPDASRDPDQATMDLDQRLKYRIGRLDTELQFRIAEIQDRRSSLIFVRVTRDFGAF